MNVSRQNRHRTFVVLGSLVLASILGFTIKPMILAGVDVTNSLGARPVLNLFISYGLLFVLVWSLWNGFSTPLKKFHFRNVLITYSLFSLGMSGVYFLVHETDHGCFQFSTGSEFTPNVLDFIYFSFVTITTLGYGDIVPVHSFTRGLVLFQVLIGLTLLLKLSRESSVTNFGD